MTQINQNSRISGKFISQIFVGQFVVELLVQVGLACPLPVFWTLLARTGQNCSPLTADYKRVDEVAKQALDSSSRVWGPGSKLGIIIILSFTVMTARTSRVTARSACVVLWRNCVPATVASQVVHLLSPRLSLGCWLQKKGGVGGWGGSSIVLLTGNSPVLTSSMYKRFGTDLELIHSN